MTTNKTRPKVPAITLAEFARAAGPLIDREPHHVSKLINGQTHSYKVRGRGANGMWTAMVCLACGEATEYLYAHPERPGLMCGPCYERCEVNADGN